MENKLVKLLEIEAKELASSYEKASLEGQGTPQEVADRREECFKSFLQKYFPFPYRLVKGNITDSFGNQRVLVYNNRQNSYISCFKEDGFIFIEEINFLLALFLFELNCISPSAPLLSENIMNIYLKNVRPDIAKSFSDINKRLQKGITKNYQDK